MRDKGLDMGLIRYFDDSHRNVRGQGRNFFGFRKMFRDYLTKLHVTYFDTCCPALTGEIFPVRFNGDLGELERFDGEDWETVTFGNETFEELEADSITLGGEIAISAEGGIVSSNYLVGFYPQAPQDNIAAATGGAIPVNNYFTTINTDAGGDAFTLADGTVVGQRKRIRLVVDGGGDGVVTPANFTDTTITFNDAGDDVELMWDGLQWFVLANLGATIA